MLVGAAQAAALGVKLPFAEPIAGMVLDIGAGATEIAILSLGDVVAEKSIRTGGDQMDEAIVDWLRRQRSLRVGLSTAEQLRIALGSACPLADEMTDEVRGLDVPTGMPQRLQITSREVREALTEPLTRLLTAVRDVLDQCSPDLVADLIDRGMVLCGGGSQLRGLDQWITERTGIPAHLADDPQTAVVRGTLICLEHIHAWRNLMESSDHAA
jgi:rod shape-determining protein MreB